MFCRDRGYQHHTGGAIFGLGLLCGGLPGRQGRRAGRSHDARSADVVGEACVGQEYLGLGLVQLHSPWWARARPNTMEAGGGASRRPLKVF